MRKLAVYKDRRDGQPHAAILVCGSVADAAWCLAWWIGQYGAGPLTNPRQVERALRRQGITINLIPTGGEV